MEVVGDPVTSVTLKDLMEMAETNTFILKLDIQDYDCQVSKFKNVWRELLNYYLVIFSQALDIEGVFENFFVPYIFIEWNNYLQSCSSLRQRLEKLGYTPWTNNNQRCVDKI